MTDIHVISYDTRTETFFIKDNVFPLIPSQGYDKILMNLYPDNHMEKDEDRFTLKLVADNRPTARLQFNDRKVQHRVPEVLERKVMIPANTPFATIIILHDLEKTHIVLGTHKPTEKMLLSLGANYIERRPHNTLTVRGRTQPITYLMRGKPKAA